MGVQWVAVFVASGSWIGARYFDWLYTKHGLRCDPERFHRRKPLGPRRGTDDRTPRSGNSPEPRVSTLGNNVMGTGPEGAEDVGEPSRFAPF
jgi:hypothetical protein